MKRFIRKQKSTLFFLFAILILFGTSQTGYGNNAPVFSEGARATRDVAENTPAGTNIGAPFTATDPDIGDTLTYSLHRGDRAAFQIDANTGQLQTKAPLDYETKRSYTNLAVRATDNNGATDAILVTINVTDVKENTDPVFVDGARAIRSIAENTPAGVAIGAPVTATDADNDTLTYKKGGVDGVAFSIDSDTGQIRTKEPLDYETKNVYSFTVSAYDGNGVGHGILVTINVTDVDETTTPLNQRTRQVRDAILKAVGMANPDAVTPAHLAGIAELDLSDQGITSLRSGDFSGLTTLESLDLEDNAITDIVPLAELTTLTHLYLTGNSISDISALKHATALIRLFLPNNSINDISALKGLTTLTHLHLNGNSISDISPLAGLTGLTDLNLAINPISDISALAGLTGLIDLNLGSISTSDISALAGLTGLTDLNLYHNSISDISALKGLIALSHLGLSGNSISDISALAGLTALTYLELDDNSIKDVSVLENLTALEHLFLNGNPISDYDPLRRLFAAIALIENHSGLSLNINIPPVFTDGTSATRSVAENTAANTNIGAAFSVTDAEDPGGHFLHYLLDGTDAGSFQIGTSGQLQTYADLDYETKSSYSVTVLVSDNDGGSDSIDVTINVTNVNEAPSFASSTAKRSVPENTASGENIGDPVAATDVDSGDTLAYTLGGTDAASFSIDNTSGQLQTLEALDYETKSSYSVTVSVSDGNDGTDSITVTIDVTNVAETPKTPVNQRTQQVRDAIIDAVGVDSADAVTREHLAVITDLSLSSVGITSLKSGDFSGLTALTYLNLRLNAITDISPLEDLTGLTTLYLAGNSISDVSPLQNLTALSDLSLSGNPISDYTPLRTLKTAIENAGYFIDIDIDINNNPPVFTDGNSTTRSVSENMPAYTKIGAAVSATDTDTGDTLTYSLDGTDAASFSIDDWSGQLETTSVLDYETKPSYSVTVSVSDGNNGKDIITVTINVTDVDETSITPINQRTQQVQDAIVGAVDVDSANAVTPAHLTTITHLDLYEVGITSLKSGDFSGLTALTALYLSHNSISDISALEDLTGLTTLDLANNAISDVSPLEDLTALESLYLYGNPISDYTPLRTLKTAIENAGNSIDIDIDINNNPPVFTDGNSTTRSVSENMPAYTKIGAAISATDTDTADTLTYSLDGTDAASFIIDDWSGQLETTSVLDYETKSSYSVTVSVSDDNDGKDIITVTINVTDVDETSITPVNQRTQQVQDAIVEAVDDVDSADAVTPAHLALITDLSLSSQGITSLKSGDFSGLTALTALYLSHNSISDISALDDLTALTVLDLVNNSISDISPLEDLTALTNLDLDNNSISDISPLEDLTALTYLYLAYNSISDISPLEDLTALENLYLYGNPISNYAPLRTLKTAIEDADNSIDIDIDINNNPPVFTDGNSTTRSVAENTGAGQNIGAAIGATDADDHTLTYSLGGTDADSFDIVSTSGQLQTKAALDYETQKSYTVTVTAYDDNSGGDRITVTIDVTEVVDENARAAPSVETSALIPEKTDLLTNFPNPFNPETWIPYQLAKPADVTLTIYDIRGVAVRELKLGHQAAGFYASRSEAIYWDGRNAFGEKVASGLYFYTLKAGDFTATRKLLIRK